MTRKFSIAIGRARDAAWKLYFGLQEPFKLVPGDNGAQAVLESVLWNQYDTAEGYFKDLVVNGLERKHPILDLRITLMVAKAEELSHWMEEHPEVKAFFYENRGKRADVDQTEKLVKQLQHRLREWMILANFSRKEEK